MSTAETRPSDPRPDAWARPSPPPTCHVVVRAREVIRVVGVQALDPGAVPHTAPGAAPVPAPSLLRVLPVNGLSPSSLAHMLSSRLIHPSASRRETALTASGQVSQ